jgi:FtsH-binding integral membrane protein
MALLPKNNVWSRTRGYSMYDEITANAYNLIFALTTAFGTAVYGFSAAQTLHATINWWISLGLFVVALIGCFVAVIDFPPLKIIGLTMISGGLGLISGPYIGHFKLASVVEIAAATVMLTLILGAIGTLIPKSLSNWGTTLLTLLVALILMQILLPLAYSLMGLPMAGLRNALDWLGVILFSAYIVYDFNRAQELQKTVSNAMDCGVSVFLDIANLFIRLLSIFGQSSDD